MKIFIIILFTVHCSLLNVHAVAQPCLPEGITFTTQEQIDNFQVNYPGCSQIEGNVLVSGADIENLYGLSGVISIGGNLQIKSNDILIELTGLQNLEYLGGDLRIEQNNVLVNLQGLENLTNLNGDLIIGDIALGKYPYSTGNPLLTSLDGLNNLLAIQGNLKLCGNYSLTTLSGLENLAIISGNFQVGGIDFVYGFTFGNPLLLNLSGLTRLSAIGGGLFIAGNSNLTNLSGLDSLTFVGQNCWFDMNESLVTLQGMNMLASIGGSLYIRWNTALSNISGLENIAAQSIQDLEIIYNQALSECSIQSICNYLAAPNGTVTISNNAPGCNSPEEVEEACKSLNFPELNTQNSTLNIQIWPNPTFGIVNFQFSTFNFRWVSLKIFDLHGREVATVLDKKLPVGEHVVRFDMTGLPEGVYIVELRAKGEGHGAVGKVIKMN